MMTKNKRKHLRVGSLNLIAYLCIDEDNNVVSQGMGRTLNVSEGGILLETHVQMDSKHTVSLTIGLEDEVVEIRGKVVFPKTGEDGKFETGIQFLEIDKTTLLTLRKYIKAFREQRQYLDSMSIKIS